MYRLPLLLMLLAGGALLSGCATSRPGDVLGLPDPRRGGSEAYYRVRPDVRRYVDQVDRYVGLNWLQERRISQILTDRTYRLLDQTPPYRHARVYPFPRRSERDRTAERWWRLADREVEDHLTREQVYRYRDLVYRDQRYSGNVRGRSERYEPRRSTVERRPPGHVKKAEKAKGKRGKGNRGKGKKKGHDD